MVTRHLLAQAVAQQFFGCFISMNAWLVISHFCTSLRMYLYQQNVHWQLSFLLTSKYVYLLYGLIVPSGLIVPFAVLLYANLHIAFSLYALYRVGQKNRTVFRSL